MRIKVSSILKMEAECHRRQATGECCREGVGCGACDLSTESVTDDDIRDAYNIAIETVKHTSDVLHDVKELYSQLVSEYEKSEAGLDKEPEYRRSYEAGFIVGLGRAILLLDFLLRQWGNGEEGDAE